MSSIRQPVVAVVGHIDHGKTTLLDYIRSSSIAAREAGGITQRVSAYEIEHQSAEGAKAITFIDTPGHEAFSGMRRRSANAADIAVLIVAADDGVKPQTIEAKKAIEEAKIPFVVAFTKIDKDTADIERAKESVLREGIYLEGLGGDVPWVGVSGKSGEGVKDLLDLLLLVADVQSISCDPTKPVSAVVIESSRDARTGVSATVIVREGTLKVGGFAVSGNASAPLRAIENFKGERVDTLVCGKPARITGFSAEPMVGSIVTTVATKKEAEALVAQATTQAKKSMHSATNTDDNVERPVLRMVLKADTAGSLEALQYDLNKVPHPDVDLLVAGSGTGTINENDVKLLIGFSPAVILGFNVKADASAKDLADRQHIMLETRPIIYELSQWLTDEIKKHEPDRTGDLITGTAKILKHFSTAGMKHVVGAKVEEGQLKRNEMVTIFRRGIEVGTGKITNMQMQRSNADTVSAGSECGLEISSRADIVSGDTVQAGGPAALSAKKHER